MTSPEPLVHFLSVPHGDDESSDLQPLLELIDTEERNRAARFRFARSPSLYARPCDVRQVLSRHADVAPEDWRFERGTDGKPALCRHHHPTRSASLRTVVSAGRYTTQRAYCLRADPDSSSPLRWGNTLTQLIIWRWSSNPVRTARLTSCSWSSPTTRSMPARCCRWRKGDGERFCFLDTTHR